MLKHKILIKIISHKQLVTNFTKFYDKQGKILFDIDNSNIIQMPFRNKMNYQRVIKGEVTPEKYFTNLIIDYTTSGKGYLREKAPYDIA